MTSWRAKATIAVFGAGLLLGGVGRHYLGQATLPGGERLPEFTLEVLDVADGRVLLEATQDATLASVGLLPADGDWYAQMTEPGVLESCEAFVTCIRRPFNVLVGDGPVAGELVKADEYFHAPGMPELALGQSVEEFEVNLDVGPAPAWFVAPRSSNVVIVAVHGRGGSRDEMLRIGSIALDLGHGLLVPTYRGDGVAPDPEDGRGYFGTREWVDVAMAMLSAEVGPDVRFVVAGSSQGGGLTAALLQQSDVAQRVDAVILDSPLIGLDATMELQARLAGIPSVLTRPILESAYLQGRFAGFNFGEGEHVGSLAASVVPLLLFHGPGDTFVPVGPSDTLAQLREDVIYERTAGVDHVRFWNHDPQAYAAAIERFLSEVLT